jgi:phasin family protein
LPEFTDQQFGSAVESLTLLEKHMTTVNIEQIVAANKATVSEVQALAATSLSGFEKLVELNMAAIKSAMLDTSADFMSAFSAQSPSDALAAQASLAKPLAEKSIAYSRAVYAIAQDAGAELTKAVEAKLATSQEALAEVIESMVKSAPAGSESVVAMFTAAVANGQKAIDSAKASAKKAFEMAEKQTNSAVDSALSQVKTTSRKK